MSKCLKVLISTLEIVFRYADEIISLFEELGFEKKHTPVVDTGDRKVTRTRMKDANGFHVDVSKVEKIPRDMTAIRMNVDDFRKAYDLLTAHGFQKAPGQKGIHVSAWGSFIGQIFLRSMDRADEIYESMQLRGFDGNFFYVDVKVFSVSGLIFTAVCITLFVLARNINVLVWLGSAVCLYKNRWEK